VSALASKYRIRSDRFESRQHGVATSSGHRSELGDRPAAIGDDERLTLPHPPEIAAESDLQFPRPDQG
jgi:hypothetical protein